MICPKCGLEQEERLDCRECGVVFSKYNSLFASPEAPDPAGGDVPDTGAVYELQIQVRELSSRLIGAEFEKAERKKLRSDLRDLQEQLRAHQAQTETRLQQVESGLESRAADAGDGAYAGAPEEAPDVEALEEKISRVSDALGDTVDQILALGDKTGRISSQVSELQDRVAALCDGMSEFRDRLEFLQRSEPSEPQTILEDDVKAIRRNLDELGQFLSGLGRG